LAKYLHIALQSSYFNKQLKSITKKSGQAFYNLGKERLLQLIIPIPPIQEQQRIATKIQDYMPLIQRYNELEIESTQLDNEIYDKLKKSILQYAIQGKLVEQDENDEPASVLLERIRAEKKAKLGKKYVDSYIYKGSDNCYYENIAGTCKKIDIDYPYELPKNWEIVRLKNICSKIVDGDHNPPKGVEKETEYLMLSSQNINYDTIVDLSKVRYLVKSVFDIENERTKLSIGDILFTSVGTLGRSCIYKGGINACFQRSVSVITTYINNEYLKMFLDSPYFQNKIIKEATGTAQKGFYLNQLENSFVVIPPLKTQEQIVDFYKKLQQKIKAEN